ncbi:MAG: aldose 1-epimerase [Jejuia sp.]
MYTTKHNQDQGILEIENTSGTVHGKIHLNAGASLQKLTLGKHKIIQDLSPLQYADTYASSILFPFANRIKDGTYSFDGDTFQLEKNQQEEQNALHGLVYNKTFNIVDEKLSKEHAKIVLEYNETKFSKGFPFTFKIQLEYVFSDGNLSLKVNVTNTGNEKFPFTLGWHPYFVSSNLKESSLTFDSTEKVVLGERNITTGTETIENNPLTLNVSSLDDCWVLNSDEVKFKTPEYHLKFSATGDNNFLQAYIPPRENTIAIEPTTGVSDSFNNKIGLETLNPKDTYSITWTLSIN